VRDYLKERNRIREKLETSIEDYAKLGRDSVRLHVIIIFNYIKDFYLRQDPVIAYDKFRATLENWAQKMNLDGPNGFF
jgi:hypothetical protein